MTNKLTIPIAIVASGIIIAIAVYVSMPKAAKPVAGGDPALVRPVGTADHILGNPAARVMIVEYSDFDCEYCKSFDETLHQVIAQAGANGEVAWVYREFPLSEIHPNALRHAEAAECAAQTAGNDAFWKFKTVLFANQPIDPTQYGVYAEKAGITGNDFSSCVAQVPATLDAHIQADRQNALDVGALGTPYSLILVAGRAPIVMNGGYSYDAVKVLVDQALEK